MINNHIQKNKRQGSIFLLAVWTLLFLSLLALLSGSLIRQQFILIEKIETRNMLYDLAQAGIGVAMDTVIHAGKKDTTPDFECLGDFWTNDSSAFKDKQLDRGTFTVSYNYHNDILEQDQINYGVIDEGRKLNLNYASEDSLVRLLLEATDLERNKAVALAYAIMDWRDADDLIQGKKGKTSERDAYEKEGYKYFPSNRFFANLEEVLLVKGMDIKSFISLREFVTVFTNGKININTASPQVLLSTGLSNSLIDKIVWYRSGVNRKDGDVDDQFFSSLETVLDDLMKYYDLSESDQEALEQLIADEVVDIESNIFTATCTSKLENSKIYGKITCVFRKTGQKLYWGSGFYSYDEGLVN